MDRKFYTDNFERLLKEKSDEFRMYPTRKVWHSIYNNIYPGRKWPSTIISVLFITALPFLGFLNTKTQHTSTEKNTAATMAVVNSLASVSATKTGTTQRIAITDNEIAAPLLVKSFVAINDTKQSRTKQPTPSRRYLNRFIVNTLRDKNSNAFASREPVKNNSTPVLLENGGATAAADNATERNIAAENYALQNEAPAQKRNNRLALQVYASPSIIYGIPSGPQASTATLEGQEASNLMNQNIGLEAGTAMQYSLSNILKLKAGLQFNYASYDMAATITGHSISTPLISNDPATTNADMLARASDFSSTASPVTLHNEMYQFSLPVGVELKLLKHNNFQWNAGATIQPTYIAGGNVYLLSSDSHIDESALINRWNLNAGFETFITYKVGGVSWQLGPQFRYQFSSTYGKAYSGVNEKLAIFGVKVGVTKALH